MSQSTISNVYARSVWDSRGRPTVEAEVTLASGVVGRSIAPAGASRGKREAIDLRDGGIRLGGMGVNKAVNSVNCEIAGALIGMDANDQKKIDQAMISLDGTQQKGNLGGNAIVAVSAAVSWAASVQERIPLWKHLNNLCGKNAPVPKISAPMIQIFGGGAHAGNRVDIQDFLVLCNGASSFSEATEWTAEIYLAASALMKQKGLLMGVCDEGGLWPNFSNNEAVLEYTTRAIETAGFKPGKEVSIALDVAASEFWVEGKYKLSLDKTELSTSQFIKVLEKWCSAYPIISLEDPLAEDDRDGFVEITETLGSSIQIIGDDFLTTNADQIKLSGAELACNSSLLKSNQCGTISEVITASEASREFGWNTIMSGRSGESEDITLSHLAVGLAADQIKVGSMTRSERTCKWNEMIRIEDNNESMEYWSFKLPN